ncbi:MULTISPECIES: hypothetical protein [unclassified Nostoc]|uniref:hypothetical protein n=1 Tax=unclassified Nostoc TaxID=2593658 RepID=UPI000DED374E|nr:MULTISPECIES: hypothetical protein [unclassified Nostoc]QHG16095.1 hypothetical protein GJB62_09000 [Nostoc sp. ATCC 53789]QLE48930.1 hypothetical protein FD724_12925 [Nostoc sp. C057]RCJ20931.1 hypothetical protein A6V25_06170 [Nostoc sp. ATCC 53789]
MSLKFEDEYAYTLDNLASALKRSYEQIKQISTFSSEFDYSQAIAKRLRAFYCSQLEIKEFLKKEVAQAGSDFFVETVLFFLKLFNDLENLGLEIASERPLQRKRNTIRPDISVWRGDELLAIIECKTQLGWHRQNWDEHFQYREQKLKEVSEEAKIFLVVMTSCNWGGFGNDSRVGEQLFCLLNEKWPTDDFLTLDSPIEQLFDKVRAIACV